MALGDSVAWPLAVPLIPFAVWLGWARRGAVCQWPTPSSLPRLLPVPGKSSATYVSIKSSSSWPPSSLLGNGAEWPLGAVPSGDAKYTWRSGSRCRTGAVVGRLNGSARGSESSSKSLPGSE